MYTVNNQDARKVRNHSLWSEKWGKGSVGIFTNGFVGYVGQL